MCSVSVYKILASEVLLYQLSMELYTSGITVLKKELWLLRREGVELPTRFKNESVNQLQRSIENVL